MWGPRQVGLQVGLRLDHQCSQARAPVECCPPPVLLWSAGPPVGAPLLLRRGPAGPHHIHSPAVAGSDSASDADGSSGRVPGAQELGTEEHGLVGQSSGTGCWCLVDPWQPWASGIGSRLFLHFPDWQQEQRFLFWLSQCMAKVGGQKQGPAHRWGSREARPVWRGACTGVQEDSGRVWIPRSPGRRPASVLSSMQAERPRPPHSDPPHPLHCAPPRAIPAWAAVGRRGLRPGRRLRAPHLPAAPHLPGQQSLPWHAAAGVVAPAGWYPQHHPRARLVRCCLGPVRSAAVGFMAAAALSPRET